MNAREIELAVARHFGTRNKICVPNISHGFTPCGWEMDLAILTGSGYLYEVEIKTSVADLRRDRHKKRWTRPNELARFNEVVSQYFIAVPIELVARIGDDLPEFAGLLSCRLEKKNPYYYPGQFYRVHVDQVRPSAKKRGRALTEGERYQLARLGVFRYWSNHPARVEGGLVDD